MNVTCVKRILRRGAALALATVLASCAPIEVAKPPEKGVAALDSLVILHTNDIHSQFDPIDPGNGGPRLGGAAARAKLLAEERARGGRFLLLDAGDLVQGTPFYNAFRGEPDHQLLDRMGYDAIALGNHDLDDGPAAWRRRADATKTPILSANVFAAAESAWAGAAEDTVPVMARRNARWVGGDRVSPAAPLRYLAKPYVIEERDGVRIAIFGLTTRALDRIVLASRNAGVAIGDPVAAARLLVPRLRSRADVVIALTHQGVGDDRKLVRGVPGIDLVVGGHSHTALQEPVFEHSPDGRAVAIVQAGSRGQYVGRTTLRWKNPRTLVVRGRLIPVRPDEGEDPRVVDFIEDYRKRLSADIDKVVYESPKRVVTSDVDEGDSPFGNFVADVIRERTGADVAIMNSGGIRSPLPQGNVTRGDILSALPFDNRLVVASMKGVRVRALLDVIARRVGGGGFMHASGVSYVIRRDRAVEIMVQGASGRPEPLDGNRVYTVATIDFVAEGGDGIDAFKTAGPLTRTDAVLSDAAAQYLETHPDYRFHSDGRVRWRGATDALRQLEKR